MAVFKVFALFCIVSLSFAHLAEARVKRQILGEGGLSGILGGEQGGLLNGVEGLLNPLQSIEGNLTDVVTTVGALLNGTTTLPSTLKEALTDVNGILQGALGTVGGLVQQLLGTLPLGLGSLLSGNQLLTPLEQVEGNLIDTITTIGSILNGNTTLPSGVKETLTDVNGILLGLLGSVNGIAQQLLESLNLSGILGGGLPLGLWSLVQ